jgi:hypothetical protein
MHYRKNKVFIAVGERAGDKTSPIIRLAKVALRNYLPASGALRLTYRSTYPQHCSTSSFKYALLFIFGHFRHTFRSHLRFEPARYYRGNLLPYTLQISNGRVNEGDCSCISWLIHRTPRPPRRPGNRFFHFPPHPSRVYLHRLFDGGWLGWRGGGGCF